MRQTRFFRTPATRFAPALSTCLLLAAVISGCKSSEETPSSRGATVDSGDLKLEVMPSSLVEIVQPTVELVKGTVTVAGQVHRKAGVAQPFGGRIDIEFLDTDGEVLDSLPALLSPTKVPLDMGSPCSFHTEYDYTPPKGSTVRLHFVDNDTAAREDLAGGAFETAHSNTGTGGTGHAAAGGRSGGTHYNNNGGSRGFK